jgi:hypothetical protein
LGIRPLMPLVICSSDISEVMMCIEEGIELVRSEKAVMMISNAKETVP